jgi:hypothetical protein
MVSQDIRSMPFSKPAPPSDADPGSSSPFENKKKDQEPAHPEEERDDIPPTQIPTKIPAAKRRRRDTVPSEEPPLDEQEKVSPAGGQTPEEIIDVDTLPPSLTALEGKAMNDLGKASNSNVGAKGVADPEEKLFEDASKGFGLRTPAGWRFTREHGDNPVYMKLTRDQKAKFRIDWAAEKLTAIKQTKTYDESYSNVDISQGIYRGLAWILCEEGGRDCPEALRCTTTFLNNCQPLGAPWIKFNQMFDRIELLVMENGFKEDP